MTAAKQNLVDDLSSAARAFPDRIALWSDAGTMTYRELDGRSSSLARWLTETRQSPAGLLGIMLPKSIEAAIAIVAGLKANMPYVPVDPSWPSRRLESIFRQSNFDVLIFQEKDAAAATDSATRLVTGTEPWEQATGDGGEFVAAERDGEDLAYILYTSGSTGDPKGVCVSNRAAYHFPNWARHEFSVDESSRIASVAPLTFDLSTFDLFSSLCGGATVYLVPEATKMLPSSLSRFLQEHRITTIYTVPSNLGLLASRGVLDKRDLSALHTVLFAGEEFPLPLFKDLRSRLPAGIRYCNLYGPTETNVCTWFDTANLTDADTAIPIGLPLPDTALFTINDEGARSEHEEGELCVNGPTVMSGYWGHGDSVDCWVPDEGGATPRAYRTGDQSSRRDDGHWLYFGRKDNMVKIWGYRVELGEIESCLLAISGIEQAAVVKISSEGEFGDSLVAFAVAGGKEHADGKTVLKVCKASLPAYMRPQAIHFIDEMPLSQNGKIERRKLAAMAKDKDSV